MIPFEIHLTVQELSVEQAQCFTQFCEGHEAKVMLIELARGNYRHQAMLSKVTNQENLEDALKIANTLSSKLSAIPLEVKRLKIEIPFYHAEQFRQPIDDNHYFEWHGKVFYHHPDQLRALCESYQAHLSYNALKGANTTRFITLRVYDTQESFEHQVAKLKVALTTAGWPIVKEQGEYCIYDDNVFLDKGWLIH